MASGAGPGGPIVASSSVRQVASNRTSCETGESEMSQSSTVTSTREFASFLSAAIAFTLATAFGAATPHNMDSGSLIKLEDGSLWLISPIDRVDTSIWLVTEAITVIVGDNPVYPYKLINTDTEEVAEAKLLPR